MALPTSGPISMSQLHAEFGRGYSLSAYYGAAPGIPTSGTISLGMFYGKSAAFRLAIAATVRSPDIRALALAAGWDGARKIECTINEGVDVATLSITNLPDNVLTLVNNGRIGGVINSGTGLLVRNKISVINNGTIFGGGGIGGDGASGWVRYAGDPDYYYGSGGAGGHGAGFSPSGSVSLLIASDGWPGSRVARTKPVGVGEVNPWCQGGAGGRGGELGLPGYAGANSEVGGNYSEFNNGLSADGGPAGRAVDGNGNITWLSTGTRLGGIV